ncbi:MAG: ABC transporter permease [Streptococcaceae bacterium]|jgi:putative ABC transport system permease protein|nr:ABC transporter permease [Streptococcaceae bacterium]
MTNKTLIRSSLRKITKSSKRFLPLLVMALLGVGFFVGIESTAPNMLTTLDRYLDQSKTYDLRVQSTLGLTDQDLTSLKQLPSIAKAQGTYAKDERIELVTRGKQAANKEDFIAKVIGLSQELNWVTLVKGRLPQKNDELVVAETFLFRQKLKVGDTIKMVDPDLSETTFRIVGTVKSPLYVAKTQRGTTSLGDGQIDDFIYVRPQVFRQGVYSSIELTVSGAATTMTDQDAYLKLIAAAKKEVVGIQKVQEKQRFETVYADYLAQSQGQLDRSRLPAAKWYLADRKDDAGYRDFVEATKSIAKIGNVFPIVFYMIAVLISLVSMARLVEEDRGEIGTLKALGFSNHSVSLTYVIFSMLATVVGGVLGTVIGIRLIPSLIWRMYTTIFDVPNFSAALQPFYALVGLLIAILCICGGALVSVYQELVHTPSVLMRPKAPKAGKRILLEYLPAIWKRFKFSNKIVIRNLFRYKTRAIVTIIGIAGCTALILSGFGLKDAITDIVSYQYGHVFKYDKLVALKEGAASGSLQKTLEQNSQVRQTATFEMTTKTVTAHGHSYAINLMVADDLTAFNKVISLNAIHHNGKQVSPQDQTAIVSQKLARLLGVKEGETIGFKTTQDQTVQIKVGKIVENYIQNYVYITKASYQKLFDTYAPNTLVISLKQALSAADNQAFDQTLMSDQAVANVFNAKVMANMVDDVMTSLNLVVLILIVSSAILAFVVMYNLATINISERKREIATLKVLGFEDKEIDAYIIKEMVIFTAIGILLGLVSGIYLSYFMISTGETDSLMFVRHVKPLSFVYATVLTISFTVLVNAITHFSLKKIDMIEALKSVE